MSDHRCEARTSSGSRCRKKSTNYVLAEDGLEYLSCKGHMQFFTQHDSVTGRNPDQDMNMKTSTIKKPIVSAEEALRFATGGDKGKEGRILAKTKKLAQEAIQKDDSRSGMVPEGDVRLTANIRGDLHMKLKMKAVMERTTIGELIEDLIEKHL